MIMNKVLKEDFEYIANSNIDFNKLRNKTVLISGATGLIGSLLIKALLYCDKVHNLQINVIGLARNIKKVNVIFSDYLNFSNLSFLYADLLSDDINTDLDIDYIFHTASVTASKYMIEYPIETIETAILGTSKLLKLATKHNVKSFVYVSSMEVYGQMNKLEKTVETDLGYIDLTNVRSCYPAGKRMCECMCVAYANQCNLNVKIARLAQTFGAGVLPNENRIFAQFARSVIEKKDIVLHTKGDSEGNYVYTSDAVVALLIILLNGLKGEAYNVNNEKSHTTIRGMAELVANEISSGNIKVVFDIPENNTYGYASDTKLWLSSEKLRDLGWFPSVDLVNAYKRLIEYLKSHNL